ETTTPVAGTEVVETTTGVLLTNDGLIVTYANQTPEMTGARYTILLFDGKSYTASFVGYDTLTNLAFFHLNDAVNTPAIALANSNDARTGKRLIAIGNTFAEYQNRLAVGILGNINRTFNLAGKSVSSSEKWEGVFEMDLSNAKSFVGGPVVGFNGEMVGLVGMLTIDNTQVPFLIPSNVVRDSSSRALAQTLGNRPALGVYYLPITKAYALGQGISRDRGALIYSPSGKTSLALLADSPAMKAGLQAGDIITAVNGQEVNLDNPLPELLNGINKGEKIELLIMRNGAEKKVEVQL
ncbi:MAG: trypsin-like peptidase domain-containing protein, partial [Patescibacteria group bacterium]